MLPYHGIASFLKTPFNATDRPIGFMGLPYDSATTYRSGAREGPAAIREAAKFLTDGEHPVFGVDPAAFVSDYGDALISKVAQADALQQIEAAVLATHAHMIFAGGDHSVSLGVLRALHRRHGPLALIHLDAHCDTWPDHFGDATGHGTWVRNAIDEGLVEARRTLQIGIRSPAARSVADWLAQRGGSVLSAEAAMAEPARQVLARLVDQLVPTQPTYVSFDIDALDPAHAPGTGTPEIGGLTSLWAVQFLQSLFATRLNLVGMDVVEVLPARDHGQITALAAATLLWTYAAGLMARFCDR